MILLVSGGLCGANYWAFGHYHLGFSGGPSPGPNGPQRDQWGLALTMTAMLEALGIVVGAVGLLGTLAAFGLAAILEWISSRKNPEKR